MSAAAFRPRRYDRVESPSELASRTQKASRKAWTTHTM